MSTHTIEYSTFTGWIDVPTDLQPALTSGLTSSVGLSE